MDSLSRHAIDHTHISQQTSAAGWEVWYCQMSSSWTAIAVVCEAFQWFLGNACRNLGIRKLLSLQATPLFTKGWYWHENLDLQSLAGCNNLALFLPQVYLRMGRGRKITCLWQSCLLSYGNCIGMWLITTPSTEGAGQQASNQAFACITVL